MQDIQEKQQKGLLPILAKAEKAVNEVASEKGLLYILDASAGKGLLVAKGEDIYDGLCKNRDKNIVTHYYEKLITLIAKGIKYGLNFLRANKCFYSENIE